MSDSFDPHWLLLELVPSLFLVSLAFSYRRSQKWEEKVPAHGQVHCRSCGFVGELLVRALSAQDHNSSNLRSSARRAMA